MPILSYSVFVNSKGKEKQHHHQQQHPINDDDGPHNIGSSDEGVWETLHKPTNILAPSLP